MCLGVFRSYRCECVVCATFWRCSATLAQVFWGLEDPREREYAACATFRRCFRGPDVFGLSPQVSMCGLRDVSEVFGGSGPCVWGLEGPCEWEDAVCATFRGCFAESRHVSMRLPLQARMCRLRDVSVVFLKVQMCSEVFVATGVDVWFARRLRGVRRIRPKCLGLGRFLRAGICGLRDASGVFCRIQTCLEAFALYKPECIVCVTFPRCFLWR
jgi:hypothetical protein